MNTANATATVTLIKPTAEFTISDLATLQQTVREFMQFLESKDIILAYGKSQDYPKMPDKKKLMTEFSDNKIAEVLNLNNIKEL